MAARATSAYLPTIRESARTPNRHTSPLRLLYVSTDAASKTLGYSDAEYAAACAALPAVGMTELRAQNATIDAVRKAIPERASAAARDGSRRTTGYRLATVGIDLQNVAGGDVLEELDTG